MVWSSSYWLYMMYLPTTVAETYIGFQRNIWKSLDVDNARAIFTLKISNCNHTDLRNVWSMGLPAVQCEISWNKGSDNSDQKLFNSSVQTPKMHKRGSQIHMYKNILYIFEVMERKGQSGKRSWWKWDRCAQMILENNSNKCCVKFKKPHSISTSVCVCVCETLLCLLSSS